MEVPAHAMTSKLSTANASSGAQLHQHSERIRYNNRTTTKHTYRDLPQHCLELITAHLAAVAGCVPARACGNTFLLHTCVALQACKP